MKAESTRPVSPHRKLCCYACKRWHTGHFVDPETGQPFVSVWCFEHGIEAHRDIELRRKIWLADLRNKAVRSEGARALLKKVTAEEEEYRKDWPARIADLKERGLLEEVSDG